MSPPSHLRRAARTLCLTATGGLFVACGGGGADASPDTAAAAPVVAVPVAVPVATPVTTPVTTPVSTPGALRVGPGLAYATPCAAFAAAGDGAVIEIDGAGSYAGDVCGIARSNLTIRGVNGRPRIDAAGKNAMGKGVWVVQGNNTTIENVEIFGARVADRNGAAATCTTTKTAS